jgi:serine/alanine adding enzyme
LNASLQVPVTIESTGTQASAPRPVVIRTDAPEADWDAYVLRCPQASQYHQHRWRRVFERAMGHECAYLSAHRDEAIVGVLPIVKFQSWLFGRLLISLPFVNYGGVLAEAEGVAEALVTAAGDLGRTWWAKHVELRHVARRFTDLPFRQHKVAMTLAVPDGATSESLWNGLDRKVRNQVRKAEKSGLVAVSGGRELLDDFYRVFAQNMRDLGTPVYSAELFEAVLRECKEDARVFVVRLQQVPVAAGITLGFRDVLENPWASSLREHRDKCPNMLLYWAMLQHAASTGHRVFDFGRSTPDEGTYHFKKQWGAREVPLHWEYRMGTSRELPDHSPKNARFSVAVQCWQRLPVGIATRLGPPIARILP